MVKNAPDETTSVGTLSTLHKHWPVAEIMFLATQRGQGSGLARSVRGFAVCLNVKVRRNTTSNFKGSDVCTFRSYNASPIRSVESRSIIMASESKIVATRRLQQEGRWEEASAYKDAQIAELRASGLKRAEAQAEAWKRMTDQFPPLEKTSSQPEDSEAVAEASIGPTVEALLAGVESDVPPDLSRDVSWVFQVLDQPDIDSESVPSRSALSLLIWARENKNRFFEVLLPKVATSFDNGLDQQVERQERKSIEQIQKILGQYQDLSKPDELDDEVEQLVDAWCQRNDRHLERRERNDLLAEIGRLVADHLTREEDLAA